MVFTGYIHYALSISKDKSLLSNLRQFLFVVTEKVSNVINLFSSSAAARNVEPLSDNIVCGADFLLQNLRKASKINYYL